MGHIVGTAGDDDLTGTAADDDIFGRAGEDTLRGEAGDDLLDGGLGNDTLKGGSGDDVLRGGAGSDSLKGGTGHDTANYEDRDAAITLKPRGRVEETGGDVDQIEDIEKIVGNASRINTIDGENSTNSRFEISLAAQTLAIFDAQTGALIDDFTVTHFSDVIGTGNGDSITGDAGNNRFGGSAGDDSLTGGAGFDTADYSALGQSITLITGGGVVKGGGLGTDTLEEMERIVGDAGQINTIDGGNSDASAFTVDLGAGTLQVAPISGAGPFAFDVENFTDVIGTASADRITGDAGDNILSGRDGNDTLWGGAGDDTLTGAGGNDTLRGGAGNDFVQGGAGNDTIWWDNADRSWVEGGAQDIGGAGYDTLQVETGSWFRTSNLDNYGFEAFVGAEHSDSVIGFRDDVGYDFAGGAGNDTLTGAGGNDTLRGGAGNDFVQGGAGNDTIWWDNADRSWVEGGAQDIGGAGYDTLQVETGSWFRTSNLDNYGFEAFVGAEHSDSVIGFRDDVGYDFAGGAGDDTLTGAGGNDTLRGGAGNDTLTGGAGADTFVFAAGDDADIITDFETGIDTLDLTSFGFDSAAEALGLAFDTAEGVVFDFGNGDVLTLRDVTKSQLGDDLLA
jgi:serralysin